MGYRSPTGPSINAGIDRLPPVTADQPPPEVVPGGVDVIADLAARIAVGGTGTLDERTAEIAHLLLAYLCPVRGSTAQRAWLACELSERRRLGVARYGTPLQVGNGRDAKADLAQELLDALAYSWQAALELDEEQR
jgi:hypothetical protein